MVVNVKDSALVLYWFSGVRGKGALVLGPLRTRGTRMVTKHGGTPVTGSIGSTGAL